MTLELYLAEYYLYDQKNQQVVRFLIKYNQPDKLNSLLLFLY